MTKANLIKEVSQALEITRPESEAIVDPIFQWHCNRCAQWRQSRDTWLRLPTRARARGSHWPQSKDGRSGRSTRQADCPL